MGIVSIPATPVWMTKFKIADLFGVFSCDIRKAIRVIYKNKELTETDTMNISAPTSHRCMCGNDWRLMGADMFIVHICGMTFVVLSTL